MSETVNELLAKVEDALWIGDQRAAGILLHQILLQDFTNHQAWQLLHSMRGGEQTLQEFQRSFAQRYYPHLAHLLTEKPTPTSAPIPAMEQEEFEAEPDIEELEEPIPAQKPLFEVPEPVVKGTRPPSPTTESAIIAEQSQPEQVGVTPEPEGLIKDDGAPELITADIIEPPPVHIQHCPKCGVTLSGQEKFCGYCGVNLEEQSPPQPAEGEKPPLANKPFCIACGKSFEPDDQFCDICGAALLRTIEVPASDTQPILRTVTTIEAVQPAAIPPPATPYLPVAAQAQPASPTTRPVQRIIPTKVPPKNATVHLFRDDYDLYKIKVWIDGDFYTKVSDHKDIMILLPAGRHTFLAKRLKTSSEPLTIDLSPGQEIYLIFSWQIKDNISIPVIELLLDSAPRPQLSKRRLSLGCSFTLLIIGGLIAIPILTIIAYIAITGEAVGWVILEELLGH